MNLIYWFVHPVEGERGMGSREWIEGMGILASCEHAFIREHKNVVQHPINNISIVK